MYETNNAKLHCNFSQNISKFYFHHGIFIYRPEYIGLVWNLYIYAQTFAQNTFRNFPNFSSILLFSVPIVLALCS